MVALTLLRGESKPVSGGYVCAWGANLQIAVQNIEEFHAQLGVHALSKKKFFG
jgi:hypothetical protein